MRFFDILDDWLLGPLNFIDRFERLITGTRFRDMGYKLKIPRRDKGGKHTLSDVERILKRYGVAVYGRTHDANHMYFHVKKRQARWAEYLLLHAGVELHSPLFDQRNPGYVAAHEPGWMPTPWAEQGERPPTNRHQEDDAEPQRKEPGSMIDRALRWLD